MAANEKDTQQRDANIKYQLEQENQKLKQMRELTDRATLSALTTVSATWPETPEDWQIIEMSVRQYGHYGEQAVKSVKSLWERIKDDPDSRYLVSHLVGLSREGMAYRDLAKKVGESPELMNLFQRAQED